MFHLFTREGIKDKNIKDFQKWDVICVNWYFIKVKIIEILWKERKVFKTTKRDSLVEIPEWKLPDYIYYFLNPTDYE